MPLPAQASATAAALQEAVAEDADVPARASSPVRAMQAPSNTRPTAFLSPSCGRLLDGYCEAPPPIPAPGAQRKGSLSAAHDSLNFSMPPPPYMRAGPGHAIRIPGE